MPPDDNNVELQGENWGVFGKMNTGKTHTTLQIAFALSKATGRRIIVFDHARNKSYDRIPEIINVERLKYDLSEYGKLPLRVQPDSFDVMQEFDNFCKYALRYIRNTIIILDDSGEFLSGNIDKTRMMFIKQTKNNYNDVFYQAHGFREVGPGLLESLQKVVLKEIAIDAMPAKLPARKQFERLHEEVIRINNQNPPRQQWAYVIYDIYQDIIIYPKKNKLKELAGRDFFRYENKHL